ncbi:MAG: hypothetical protein ACO3SJ_11320, partial [Phycisphaerales bacterium]
ILEERAAEVEESAESAAENAGRAAAAADGAQLARDELLEMMNELEAAELAADEAARESARAALREAEASAAAIVRAAGRFSIAVEGSNLELSTDPAIAATGIALAMLVGVLAGLVPGLQSARGPIVSSLRTA